MFVAAAPILLGRNGRVARGVVGTMGAGRAFAAALAAALAGLSGWSLAQTAAPVAMRNDGRSSDGDFYVDFARGFDPDTQIRSDWDIDAGWLAVSYREENASFGDRGLTLVARRERTPIAEHESAEFQQRGFYGYGRYEVVMRASGAQGVVSSFFVYTGEDVGDPHDEIDFEFVGRNPRRVHLNIFNDGKDDPADIDLWFDASAGEHLYAFEWRPDAVTWYVDGVKVRQVTKAASRNGLPSTTGKVMASIWAANRTSVDWVGAPRFERATAFYRCMSHVRLGASGKQCSDTFKPPPRG